jgi:hypothetical protein
LYDSPNENEWSSTGHCSGSDNLDTQVDDISYSCQDLVATPETKVSIRIFVTDQDSPYLSLHVGEFGAFYPDIENDNEHFYFTYLNRVLIKDFSSNEHPFLMQVTIILVLFEGMDDEEYPHPFFTHSVPNDK